MWKYITPLLKTGHNGTTSILKSTTLGAFAITPNRLLVRMKGQNFAVPLALASLPQ